LAILVPLLRVDWGSSDKPTPAPVLTDQQVDDLAHNMLGLESPRQRRIRQVTAVAFGLFVGAAVYGTIKNAVRAAIREERAGQ
jgi:hypothetical protein